MTTERARCIPEEVRRTMTAEAMALAYNLGTRLGRREVLEAIAATLESTGDPLEKVWIEDTTGKRRTLNVEDALRVLGSGTDFRYLWALPESERRNSKSRWLTAATIDNLAPETASLFFALPYERAQQFRPHVQLLRALARSNLTPQYGFGYARQYGDPDHFAFSYLHSNTTGAIELADWEQPAASGRRGGGKSVRAAEGHGHQHILDVFPMNVLSDAHLQQKLGEQTFREWILEHTGADSLIRIDPRCFVWFVPVSQTALLSRRLKQHGMTLRDPPGTAPQVLTWRAVAGTGRAADGRGWSERDARGHRAG